jgi:hypothetical protein
LGFQFNAGRDLDAVIELYGTLEENFRVLLDVKANTLAAGIYFVVGVRNTDNTLEVTTEPKLRLAATKICT